MSIFETTSLATGGPAARRQTRTLAGIASLGAVCLAVGGAISLASPGREAALILAIAAAGLGPVVIRLVTGRLDVFEPLVAATVAFVLLFIARPIVDHALPTREFAGQNVEPNYAAMLVVVLVGVASFQLGYALVRSRPVEAPSHERRAPDVGVLFFVGLALTTASVACLLLRALLAGGLSTLFADRSELGPNAVNVPVITESVMLALPAALVLWSVPPPHRAAARLLSVVPLGVLLVSALPQGNRRDLLPAIVAFAALPYLRRGTRPRVVSLALLSILAFFLIVTPLRVSRNGEVGYWPSLVAGIEHPSRSVEALFEEQDTAMTTALAIEVRDVGTRIPWQHGSSLLAETVLQPVPRQLWAGKPETIRTQLIELNWGVRRGICFSQCPTFSVLGSLYADAGMFTVAAGCSVFGALLAAWYRYFQRRRGDPLLQAACAATVFLPFYVWWSNLGVLVLHFALLAGPLVIASALSRPKEAR